MGKKLAVCVVVFDGDKILATHRRDNETDWGLPGGKVEPGEFQSTALTRELLEETGYFCKKFEFIRVRRDNEYDVYCYSAKFSDLVYMTDDNENLGAWVEPTKVLEGCFGDFNKSLFKYMNLEKYITQSND